MHAAPMLCFWADVTKPPIFARTKARASRLPPDPNRQSHEKGNAMICYFDKARQGRTIALSLHQNGAVMFFPEEIEAMELSDRPAIRQAITQMSKPMFVRSSSVETGAMIGTPRAENSADVPYLLTNALAVEDDTIETVLRLVA
eukprot:TRINITY_DN7006_c0_g1_i1.p1 TRINITY_DN7006_c0_g1~~TRINITY_DN7006_c0_g1_i1.p1  ORF type:complete len:144 (-),score=10.73 TRINITY_DN7006_c0_g1_i1:22-453(-)